MTGTATHHATCVALETSAGLPLGVILRGPSGVGKSDLALRLIATRLPWLPNRADAPKMIASDAMPPRPAVAGAGPANASRPVALEEPGRSSGVATGRADRFVLVGDDRIRLDVRTAEGERPFLIARSHPAIFGLIEVRGLGLVRLPAVAAARVVLAVDLVAHHSAVHRLPEPAHTRLQGVDVAHMSCVAWDASAPQRVALALASAAQSVAV